MSRFTFAFSTLLAGALLSACDTNPNPAKPPPTVQKVDLARCMGRWHNIAWLPNSLQKGCAESTIEYKRLPDGTVSVVSRCVAHGRPRVVKGSARVVNTKTNAIMEVAFDEPMSVFIPPSPKGNYFVLWLASDYSAAAAGAPDHKCLWILARDRTLTPPVFHEIMERCRNLGFAVDKLVFE